MTNKVNLVNIKGPTSIRIDAEITDEGDLLISGQDIGDAPREFWQEDDYEYWLRIEGRFKDQVLLALLEKFYSGNPNLDSELKEYLHSKGIPTEFTSF